MKIFKELNKLGYIHYSDTTIEELDDLPLNSAERISEQALVFRWFREKYNLKSWIQEHTVDTFIYEIRPHKLTDYKEGEVYVYKIHEEAELACLQKLIQIVKYEKLAHTTNR